jgi:AcrR family transcriptional regulator
MTRHLSEAERREQIVQAARTLFVEHGFLATRVEDIAKKAGLSKGAVYFYFESKRVLFDTLVEEEVAVTLSFLELASADSRPAAEKLVELGMKYLNYYGGLQQPPRFFLLMTEMAIRDEGIRARALQIHTQFVDLLAALIGQGISEGAFRQQDPRAAALMLKALVDGLAGQSAVGIRPDMGRLSTDGIRLILEGLGSGSAPAENTGTEG